MNQIETLPSPSVSPKRVPGIAQAIALNALYGGVVIVVTIALLLFSRFGGVSLDMFSHFLVQQIIAWPITLWVGLRWSKASFLDVYPLTRFPIRIVPALFIAFFGLTILAIASWSLIPMPEALQKFIAQAFAGSGQLAIFLSLVLGAPVGEELFFRGLVLRGFLGGYSVTKAVWASALLWAVCHLNPWQAVGALPLGLALAWLVLRTGSLIPSIIGHMIANFLPATFFLHSRWRSATMPKISRHWNWATIHPRCWLSEPRWQASAALSSGASLPSSQMTETPNTPSAADGRGPRSAESFCHDQRKTMSASTNRWLIAAAIAALILGAILSRAIEPSVRVEKIMLTTNTPALRLFPATPGPHPNALLAHGGGGSKEMLFRFGEALAAAGFDCYSVDQAGQGESPQPISLTNILIKPRELERALGGVDVFVGHSLGGGAGAWSVREDGFRPKLFIALESDFHVGEHGPPPVVLISRFSEFMPLLRTMLRTQTNAQVVFSPWSEHITACYDSGLVNAGVKAACAAFGKPVPAAPTAWRWRLLGLLLGIAGALVLMFRLPELHPRLARIRRFIVPSVLLLALVLTLWPWVGVSPQLRRVPAHLIVLGVVWLALAGARRLRMPRWSLLVVTAILVPCCFAIYWATDIFFFGLLFAILAISALLSVPAVAVGRIAARGGSRRDGDLAMAIFASYVIGQFMPLFY